MELTNPTVFPSLAFRQFDADGNLDAVVAMRGSFVHAQGDRSRLAATQEGFVWEDTYEGDPHLTPLLRQTDLTPGKTGTDVTFLGASTPLVPATEWACGIEIGPVRKHLRVTGPRVWTPLGKARGPAAEWRLTDPALAVSVSMDWRLTSDGRMALVAGDGPVDPRNPLGIGLPDDAADPDAVPLAAPQITGADSFAPAGLGPLSPFWADRARHAGTYDDAWLATRHPLLPQDFDPRFWQSAPEDQVARPFLQGDEPYRLTHLSAADPVAEGWLPALAFAVEVDGHTWLPMDLDGVQFDWREEHLILMTWRVRFPLADATRTRLRIGWRVLQTAGAAA